MTFRKIREVIEQMDPQQLSAIATCDGKEIQVVVLGETHLLHEGCLSSLDSFDKCEQEEAYETADRVFYAGTPIFEEQ